MSVISLYLDKHYPMHDVGEIASGLRVSYGRQRHVRLVCLSAIHIIPFNMFVDMIFESDLPLSVF